MHGQTTQTTPSESTIVGDQDDNGQSDFLDRLDLASLPEWQQYTSLGGAFGDLAPVLDFDFSSGSYLVVLGTRAFEVDKVLGVGRHKQTFLTRIGSSHYVLPIVYHVDAGRWDPLMPENWYTWIDTDANGRIGASETVSGLLYPTPSDTPVQLRRAEDSWERNCAGCHVTGLNSVKKNNRGEFVIAYFEDGVSCEACHGPGRLHSADLGGQSYPDRAIVNPNLLAASQHRDICMSCHSRGTSAGRVRGNTLSYPWHPDGSAFLPGDVLADAFSIGAMPHEALHALQGGQLHEGAPGSTYGAWSQDCQDCHSAHDSTNLSRIRMQVPTPPAGALRDVVFTARSGAPGSGGLMGDATDAAFTDVCEVCHTLTSYFRNDSSTPATDHNNGQACTDCHWHSNGFLAGGSRCTDCHQRPQPPGVEDRRQVVQDGLDGQGDFVKPSHHVDDGSGLETVVDSDCVVCHDQGGHQGYMDPQVLLADADGSASILFDGTGASLETFCRHCHDADGQGGNLAPFSSGSAPADIEVWWAAAPSHASPAGLDCWTCHRNGHGSDNPALGVALEEDGCLACHDGGTASADVLADFDRAYAHPIRAQSHVHEADEDPMAMPRHVECEDCHNPHAADGSIPGIPPAASGHLAGVGGMDGSGSAVFPVTNGYELCYECHADTTTALPAFPRVLAESNVRREFDGNQPSFHPVEEKGQNPDVPSLIGGWTVDSVMTCWDCHAGSTAGPHGSDFPWILKLRYDTADRTQESPQAYALCYSCHDRSSILNDDSFDRHRDHIVEERTPCSACHDPHGSDAHSGNLTGAHLVNFRTDIVAPNGSGALFFRDDGRFHGTCSLRCHGEGHSNESY